MTQATVPMDTFKWIVTGLLSVLIVGVGWFLSDIRADLRDVRRRSRPFASRRLPPTRGWTA